MITKAIKHITIGQTKRLYKPVGYTMLANFINIVPFCLSIEVINTLFKAFDGTGTPLNISKLWGLIVIMFVYIIFMIFGEKKSYNANFREAYNISAEGRIALAEHLRKLSLGFLYKKDSGELSSMLITDFAMTEQWDVAPSSSIAWCTGHAYFCFFRFIVRRLADVYCYVFIPSYFFFNTYFHF